MFAKERRLVPRAKRQRSSAPHSTGHSVELILGRIVI